MQPGGDHAGDVGDVRQQKCPGLPGNPAHPLEIYRARIGARAHRNHFRFVLARHLGQLIVIYLLGVLAHSVVDDFKKPAGKVRFVAVREMAAVREVHGKHPVARFEDREIHRHVGAASGVGLHVCVFRPEKFFRAVNGQLLDYIHVLAAAIPAFPGVALGVFIG